MRVQPLAFAHASTCGSISVVSSAMSPPASQIRQTRISGKSRISVTMVDRSPHHA
jgi:hypothetical protein